MWKPFAFDAPTLAKTRTNPRSPQIGEWWLDAGQELISILTENSQSLL
ncbi:MAG: hypothetical protein F6K55_07015 [Moorea sp. SIO4A3]|nr:hypothetical protein [Moorena sp. SIO4A3]